MSLMKLRKSDYIPVAPFEDETEHYDTMASELYLVTVSPIYKLEYHYPRLLHIRQTLRYFHLDCLNRIKVFHQ